MSTRRSSGAVAGPDPMCIPKNCSQLTSAGHGQPCGYMDDGCGGQVYCGCQIGASCQNGSCCVPTTCAQAQADCGSIPDGCGGVAKCGSCPAGQTCGMGGVNKCGQSPFQKRPSAGGFSTKPVTVQPGGGFSGSGKFFPEQGEITYADCMARVDSSMTDIEKNIFCSFISTATNVDQVKVARAAHEAAGHPNAVKMCEEVIAQLGDTGSNLCLADADCGPYGMCKGGQCVLASTPVKNTCKSNADCGSNQECVGGVCQLRKDIEQAKCKAKGEAASSQAECCTGLKLVQGRCEIAEQDQALCDATHPCPANLECVDGKCQPKVAKSNMPIVWGVLGGVAAAVVLGVAAYYIAKPSAKHNPVTKRQKQALRKVRSLERDYEDTMREMDESERMGESTDAEWKRIEKIAVELQKANAELRAASRSRNPAPRKGRKGGVMLSTAPYNIEQHLLMGDEVRGRTQRGAPHGYFIRVFPYEGKYIYQVAPQASFSGALQRETFHTAAEAAKHMSNVCSTSQGLTWHRPAKQNPARGATRLGDPDHDVYRTTFCNQLHRVSTGMPVGHNCYKLPPAALKAEIRGDYDKANDILSETQLREAGRKSRLAKLGRRGPKCSSCSKRNPVKRKLLRGAGPFDVQIRQSGERMWSPYGRAYDLEDLRRKLGGMQDTMEHFAARRGDPWYTYVHQGADIRVVNRQGKTVYSVRGFIGPHKGKLTHDRGR